MGEGLVIASNRGPVSWKPSDDGPVAKRGFGGLVTALGGALQTEPGTWISVALSETDREVAAAHDGTAFEVDADGSRFRLRLLDAGEQFDPYYNEVANRLLWFTVHGLWAAPYEPTGVGWPADWDEGYLPVNNRVAEAVAEAAEGYEGRGEVLLQDYHLCTAGRVVRDLLPGARYLHYMHTPWVGPNYLRRLPDRIVEGVLRGLLSADVVAFSSPLWTAAFRKCAVELLDATLQGDAVLLEGQRTVVADFTLGVDEEDLASSAASDEVATAGADLDDEQAGRRMLLRVDRADLSKNILRGLWAYELLLERHPEHRGRVWHYAHLNPSRQGVDEYRDYLSACRETAERIQERFGDDALTVFVGDDYPRAVAALQRFDVLLANPVLDGTNLVAKEGPVLNTRDGVVVLSRNAGAVSVLGDGALLVNPYDVESQAEALHRALTMGEAERAGRAEILRAAARLGAPDEWLNAQRQTLRATVARRR
ncbi:MAG TPA: trehalose-6-phosphate synthase [Egibacteraceae bacterium]|nr:trehalose-6-phosphate synthase [Egibacteraceae bacterium]